MTQYGPLTSSLTALILCIVEWQTADCVQRVRNDREGGGVKYFKVLFRH